MKDTYWMLDTVKVRHTQKRQRGKRRGVHFVPTLEERVLHVNGDEMRLVEILADIDLLIVLDEGHIFIDVLYIGILYDMI